MLSTIVEKMERLNFTHMMVLMNIAMGSKPDNTLDDAVKELTELVEHGGTRVDTILHALPLSLTLA